MWKKKPQKSFKYWSYIYSITLAAMQGMNCKIARAEMGKLIAK